VRLVLAIVVAAIALGGAAFLASADLIMHGHYYCDTQGAPPGECNLQGSYWVADRAAWQIPVAILIGAAGLGAAFLLAREKGTHAD